MKLLSQLAKTFLKTRNTASELTQTSQAWLRGDDFEENRSSKMVAPYSQSAWVYVAVSVLGETVANIPFRLSRGKGKARKMVDSGPLYELFQNPHPSMSRSLFWQSIVSWDALRGEFFVVPLDERGQPLALGLRKSKKPVALLPLSPDSFSHILQGHDLLAWKYLGLEQSTPLATQLLMPEEVVFSRNFNPYYFWRGLSPLKVALLTVESEFAAEQFMKGLMVNNGDAGVIVTSEEMMDEVQREQVVAAVNDHKRHAGMADRPLFLWGKTKVDRPTISSADLQLLECRKLNRQEIGAIFKVPESMMGFAGQKSMLSGGSAIEQDRLNFLESTICGLCHRIESAMEVLIKSFDPEMDGWFDVESLPIMQAARRERISIAQKAFALGVPFNDINQLYDLGFESLPWGNRGYVEQSLREVGVKNEPATLQIDLGPGNADSSIRRFLELLEPSEIEAPANQNAKEMAGKLKKFFFEQRGRVLERLEHQNSPDEAIFDLETENQYLLERLLPLKDRFDTIDSINKATCDAINVALHEGSALQEPKTRLAERIKSVFNKVSSRAAEIGGIL